MKTIALEHRGIRFYSGQLPAVSVPAYPILPIQRGFLSDSLSVHAILPRFLGRKRWL